MLLKLAATNTVKDSTALEVIDANTLRYNCEDYYFDPGMAHYEPQGPILSAHRDEAGALFVRVHVMYTDASREVWQTPDADGHYRGYDYEEHGVGVVLAPPLPMEPNPEEASV